MHSFSLEVDAPSSSAMRSSQGLLKFPNLAIKEAPHHGTGFLANPYFLPGLHELERVCFDSWNVQVHLFTVLVSIHHLSDLARSQRIRIRPYWMQPLLLLYLDFLLHFLIRAQSFMMFLKQSSLDLYQKVLRNLSCN